MSSTMTFFLGVISSIVGTLILYYFRYQLGFLINLIFYRVYPDVTGEYNVYQYSYSKSKKDESVSDYDKNEDKLPIKATNQELLKFLKKKDRKVYMKIKLKQFAYKISGELILIKGSEVRTLEVLKGRVTPSRVLILNSETKTRDHHNFGTFLINLTTDPRILRGTRSVLCISCGNATSVYQIMEKNN